MFKEPCQGEEEFAQIYQLSARCMRSKSQGIGTPATCSHTHQDRILERPLSRILPQISGFYRFALLEPLLQGDDLGHSVVAAKSGK